MNRIAGIFPRLIFKDKSTYVDSSTKIYDDVRDLLAAIYRRFIKYTSFIQSLRYAYIVVFSPRWLLSICPGCCTLSLDAMPFIAYYMWNTKAGTLGCSVCFMGSC